MLDTHYIILPVQKGLFVTEGMLALVLSLEIRLWFRKERLGEKVIPLG